MAEPKTWIDVTNTAVTIGLAAIVGGGFSVLLATLNHRREAQKEYLKRRREITEKILDDFDKFADAQSVHWAKLANAVYAREQGKPELADATAEVEQTETTLWDSYRLLLPCRSRLLLLGEKGCEAALMKFRDVSDEFFKIATVGNPKCTTDTLAQHKATILVARSAFYESLSRAHSKTA